MFRPQKQLGAHETEPSCTEVRPGQEIGYVICNPTGTCCYIATLNMCTQLSPKRTSGCLASFSDACFCLYVAPGDGTAKDLLAERARHPHDVQTDGFLRQLLDGASAKCTHLAPGPKPEPGYCMVQEAAGGRSNRLAFDSMNVWLWWLGVSKSAKVHPLVSRILAVVEGTSSARLAECLGEGSLLPCDVLGGLLGELVFATLREEPCRKS